MNVRLIVMVAMTMPFVKMLMEVIHVRVMTLSLEMALTAQVSIPPVVAKCSKKLKNSSLSFCLSFFVCRDNLSTAPKTSKWL